jgi:hypothetical protein
VRVQRAQVVHANFHSVHNTFNKRHGCARQTSRLRDATSVTVMIVMRGRRVART